jgi:hypothetical protein
MKDAWARTEALHNMSPEDQRLHQIGDGVDSAHIDALPLDNSVILPDAVEFEEPQQKVKLIPRIGASEAHEKHVKDQHRFRHEALHRSRTEKMQLSALSLLFVVSCFGSYWVYNRRSQVYKQVMGVLGGGSGEKEEENSATRNV